MTVDLKKYFSHLDIYEQDTRGVTVSISLLLGIKF
jgi:hypothetical protein